MAWNCVRAAGVSIIFLLGSGLAMAEGGAGDAGTKAATALPAAPELKKPTDRKLVIAIKESPPFTIKREDGSWDGISVELWRQVAEQLKVEYEYKEMQLDAMLAATAAGECDVAIAALTVTDEREALFDFSHPYHSSGLGIATQPRERGWLSMVLRIFTGDFIAVLAMLAVLLFGVGFVLWLFERRANSEEFGGPPIKGLGSAFWWSAVTMTTVGYGDKAPRTFLGRVVGTIWMFAGIIVISFFTAAIASSLTVQRMEGAISGPESLPNVRVATVRASSSANYLQQRGIGYVAHDDLKAALQALVDGKTDAVVYDAPILKYMSTHEFSEPIKVLDTAMVRQDYAFAMANDSKLREPINRVILRRMHAAGWEQMIERYMGAE